MRGYLGYLAVRQGRDLVSAAGYGDGLARSRRHREISAGAGRGDEAAAGLAKQAARAGARKPPRTDAQLTGAIDAGASTPARRHRASGGYRWRAARRLRVTSGTRIELQAPKPPPAMPRPPSRRGLRRSDAPRRHRPPTECPRSRHGYRRAARGRQALRIGHRREVAVVGVADPARARQIGAIFAGAAAADHRLARRGDDVRIEAVALGRKTLAVEFRIAFARARRSRDRRMPPDGASTKVMRSLAGSRHSTPRLAQRQRLQLRQEFASARSRRHWRAAAARR